MKHSMHKHKPVALVCPFCCCDRTLTKTSLGRNDLSQLASHTVHHLAKPGRNSKQEPEEEAEAETMRGTILTVLLPSAGWVCFFYTTHLSRSSTTTLGGLGSSTSSINQKRKKNSAQFISLLKAIPQVGLPLPRWVGCVKLQNKHPSRPSHSWNLSLLIAS